MSGTEFALRHPESAARLVLNPEADQHNAWDVLASAYGNELALELVRSAGADYALIVCITNWMNQGI